MAWLGWGVWNREPELRLSMLALLECVLKQEEVTEAGLRPHAEQLVREMVLPNAVWRAGMVAAAVRKVGGAAATAMACWCAGVLAWVSPPSSAACLVCVCLCVLV